ncbi:ribonuclease H-like domain-containing protein [Tanacetum coccineum]
MEPWVPIPYTAPESGPSRIKNDCSPLFYRRKGCARKMMFKARILLLMALPNEHHFTHQLQKLVSRLAILGVDTSPEDLIILATPKLNCSCRKLVLPVDEDATLMPFCPLKPQGSQLVHEDLEQIHDDDLEEMDLKWNMALLSMRARKFYQRTGRKIVIDGSSTAGYDKSKVECFNCHKMGHFARECQEDQEVKKTKLESKQASESYEVQANMALMAFLILSILALNLIMLKNETLKKQYDDTIKLDDTALKHLLIKRIPTPLDLSYSGLEEFQHPEINGLEGTKKASENISDSPILLKIGVRRRGRILNAYKQKGPRDRSIMKTVPENSQNAKPLSTVSHPQVNTGVDDTLVPATPEFLHSSYKKQQGSSIGTLIGDVQSSVQKQEGMGQLLF